MTLPLNEINLNYHKYRQFLKNTCTERTVDNYCSVIEDFLLRFRDKAHRVPDNFHRHDIADYRDVRIAEGISPRTLNYQMDVLKAFWNWMMEREMASYNPAQLKSIKETELTRRPVTRDDQEKILAAAADTREKLLFLLALTTGVRGIELSRIKWTNIDWERRVLLLDGEQTKNRKSRTLPLREDVISLLREYQPLSPHDTILGWCSDTCREKLRQMCNRAGVSKRGLHDLRRTYATYMLRAGTDIYTVRDLLGHADLTTTAKYLIAEDPETIRERLGVFCGDRVLSPQGCESGSSHESTPA